MFSYCESLEFIDISNFKTKNTKYMSSMFDYCSSLKSIDFSNFDTGNVEDMSFML